MASLWEQTWEEPGFPALEGDLSTDVPVSYTHLRAHET